MSENAQNTVAGEASGALAGNKSRTKTVLGVIFDIFTVIVVIFVLVLLVLMFQLRGLTSEGISLGGYRAFLVQTMSMSPVYPAGSVVVTKQVPLPEIKVGDVITFRSGYSSALVTHRVVEVNGFGESTYRFTTRGDANNVDDAQRVDGRDVLGVVSFGVPNVGAFMGWLRSVWGLVLLVIVPSTLVIIGESVKLARTIKEEKNKRQAAEEDAPATEGAAVLEEGRQGDEDGVDGVLGESSETAGKSPPQTAEKGDAL